MATVSLRQHLAALGLMRNDAEEKQRSIRREIGKALLEVRDDDDLTFTEAADILGISRPTVYRLLHDAEGGE